MSEQDDISLEVRQHLARGLGVIHDWIRVMPEDPGKALAHITWLSLKLAQEAQRMTESVMADEDAVPRFFSMDGALFATTGRAITLERDYFTILETAVSTGIGTS